MGVGNLNLVNEPHFQQWGIAGSFKGKGFDWDDLGLNPSNDRTRPLTQDDVLKLKRESDNYCLSALDANFNNELEISDLEFFRKMLLDEEEVKKKGEKIYHPLRFCRQRHGGLEGAGDIEIVISRWI